MNYLKIESAIQIVRLLRLVADFVPGSGARCTLCGEWNRAETGVKILRTGKKTRYHACINCGHKFSSEESP
ncbi:MAG: hypothetical protein HQM10_03855 [Candidatus Riflebacteria bacterium]|nr:hypothetical protein [Candidatus Riflebacteria bacterium]